jgi:hypothetical protein
LRFEIAPLFWKSTVIFIDLFLLWFPMNLCLRGLITI